MAPEDRFRAVFPTDKTAQAGTSRPVRQWSRERASGRFRICGMTFSHYPAYPDAPAVRCAAVRAPGIGRCGETPGVHYIRKEGATVESTAKRNAQLPEHHFQTRSGAETPPGHQAPPQEHRCGGAGRWTDSRPGGGPGSVPGSSPVQGPA